MSKSCLYKLCDYGQSLWLDLIARNIIQSGELARMVEEDGLRGITSNPTIFMNAIIGENDYDPQIKELSIAGRSAKEIYYALTDADIISAADILKPVFADSDGFDGFVSIEVLPEFAYETEKTCAEAERLFNETGRDNVMVKVPGTKEGIPAIKEMTARGHKINVTLLFSRSQYEQVAQAYMDGLEKRAEHGLELHSVVSVASVYLGRTDAKVDALIDAMLAKETDSQTIEELKSLRGQAAIATARTIYKRFREIFSSDRWKRLEDAGARVQRPLWASVANKDPVYRDVKYVEALIGRDTIITIPKATLLAFRDHGIVAPTLEEGLDEAPDILQRIKDVGIDLDGIYSELQTDGVSLFEKSYEDLAGVIEGKRKVFVQARNV